MSSARLEGDAARGGTWSRRDPVRRVLAALDEGRLLAEPVTAALWAASAAVVLGAVVLAAQDATVWRFVPGAGMAAAVLQTLVAVVACVAAALVLRARARTVRIRTHAPFIVIPTIANLFRTAGEWYAALHLGFGLAAALWTWITGANPMFLLGSVLGGAPDRLLWTPDFDWIGNAGLRGAAHVGTAAVIGYGCVVAAYFVAELTVVLVHIASHVRRPASGSPSGEYGAYCTRCGAPVPSRGSRCEACNG